MLKKSVAWKSITSPMAEDYGEVLFRTRLVSVALQLVMRVSIEHLSMLHIFDIDSLDSYPPIRRAYNFSQTLSIVSMTMLGRSVNLISKVHRHR